MKEKNVDSFYRPETTWYGRSLRNYISLYPKAKGAQTLTEARVLVHGEKPKRYTCRCGQSACRRLRSEKSSHC